MDKIIETKEYDEEIIKLWQQAFKDSREDVIFFLENARNVSCLCYYSDDCLCSMLFLVDCVVDDNNFKYIYAACTNENCREKGYMSKLLDYSQRNYQNVLLIPADEDLVKYYSNRKFTYKVDIDNILFDECSEIKEYLFEGCSLSKPFALAFRGE
jgi:hypothetical protein